MLSRDATQVLGRALKDLSRDQIIVCTKVRLSSAVPRATRNDWLRPIWHAKLIGWQTLVPWNPKLDHAALLH